MARTAFVFTVIAMFLAGCGAHMTSDGESVSARSASCKSADSDSDCSIVVDAWMNGDGTCSAEVIKSQEKVGFKKNAKDKWVEWEFTAAAEDAGFRFPSNGIEPKSTPEGNAANWAANFGTQGGAVGNGKRFKRKNTNDPRAQPIAIEYFYMVNVELQRPPLAPLPCKPQDPVIKNQR